MKWTDVPVHVVDFEGSVRSGVVEFGVVTLVGGEIEALHTRVCAPHEQISPAEMRIHRLGPQNVGGAAPFRAEWTRFAGLRETGVFAAHFSATEHALLRAAWPVPRLSPDFLALPDGARVAEWGPWIDTGRLAVSVLPQGGTAGLAAVVQALGLEAALVFASAQWCPPERRQFHCAPFDALACALVLRALARDQNGEAWTLARVLTASTANLERREERQQARWF